jgi:spore germination protein
MLLPPMFALAMMPSDVFKAYQWILHLGNAGMILMFGYPLLLWLAYLIRRAGREASS